MPFDQDKQALIKALTESKTRDLEANFKGVDKDYIQALEKAYAAVISYLVGTVSAPDTTDFTQHLLAAIPIANVKAHIRLLDVLGKIPANSILQPELPKTKKRELGEKLLQKKTKIDSPLPNDLAKDGYNFRDAKDGLLDSLDMIAIDSRAASSRKLLISAGAWEQKINLAKIKIEAKLKEIENNIPSIKSARTLQLWQVIANEGLLPAGMIWHCVLMFAQNSNEQDAIIDINILRGYLSNTEVKISASLSDALYDFFIKNQYQFPMSSGLSTFRQIYAEWQFDPLNLAKVQDVFSHADLTDAHKTILMNVVLNNLPKEEKRIAEVGKLMEYLNTLLTGQDIEAESSKAPIQRLRSFSLRASSSTEKHADTRDFGSHNTLSGTTSSLRRMTQPLNKFMHKSKNTTPNFTSLIEGISDIIMQMKHADYFMSTLPSSLEKQIALLRPALLQEQKMIKKLINTSDSSDKQKILDELNNQVDVLLITLDAVDGISKLQKHVTRLQGTRSAISSSDPLIGDWSRLLNLLTNSHSARAIDTLKHNFEKSPIDAPKKFEGIDSNP